MKNFTRIYGVLLCVLLGLSVVFCGWERAYAENGDMEDLRRVADRSLGLLEKNLPDQAEKLLKDHLKNCESDSFRHLSLGEDPCAKILKSSLGYLHASLATKRPESSRENLSAASKYYGEVLEKFPEDIDAIKNLAIVEQRRNNWDRAIELFEKARKLAPEKNYAFTLAMGDIYKSKGETREAMAYYERAAKIDPGRQEAHRRIMSLYRQNPEASFEDLFSHASRLQMSGQKQLARQAMELAIWKSYKDKDGKAEQALVYWADLCAGTGWISIESLDNLPSTKSWPARPLRELSLLLKDPSNAFPKMKWWASDERVSLHRASEPLRKDYTAASVMKTLADNLAARGDIKKAARTFQDALKLISGSRSGRYFQTTYEAPDIFFGIATDLALLYHRNPELDPTGEKLNDLILELFQGKGKAYGARDREAIRRYHTALGIIYAERGIWESEWAPANAFFQLRHALENSPSDQQNPFLSELLARGYMEKGYVDDAVESYTEAITGYLDRDQLKRAEDVLQKAKSARSGSGRRFSRSTLKRLNACERIIDARKRIDKLSGSVFDEDSPRYFRNTQAYSWLFDEKDMALPDGLIQRQAYKVLVDLARRAENTGNELEAQKLFTRALSSAEKVELFLSMEDLKRMESIQTSILKSVDLQNPSAMVRFSRGDGSDLSGSHRVWRMELPQQAWNFNVSVGKDFLLANRIVAKTADMVGKASQLPRISIDNGNVDIHESSSLPADNPLLLRNIKTIEGVRSIKEKAGSRIKRLPQRAP